MTNDKIEKLEFENNALIQEINSAKRSLVMHIKVANDLEKIVYKQTQAIQRVRELHTKITIIHPKHDADTPNAEDGELCESCECIACMRSLPHLEPCPDGELCGCYITESPCTCDVPVPGCTGWYHEECEVCEVDESGPNAYSPDYGDVYLRWPCPTIKALDSEQS